MSDLRVHPRDRLVCEVRGLTLTRVWPGAQEVTILSRLSFAVSAGTIVCIQGRSGAGKSSLLHVIAGMLRPTSGQVLVDEHDVWALDDDARARIRREKIGLVLQDGGVLDSLTVLENVLMAAANREEEHGLAALDSVGIAHRARARPRHISMGERYRVAIARALLAEPEILLLDEPTAALDRSSAGLVLSLLQSLRDERTLTVIVATHDPDVAAVAEAWVQLS